jgi:hypothetical protein
VAQTFLSVNVQGRRRDRLTVSPDPEWTLLPETFLVVIPAQAGIQS